MKRPRALIIVKENSLTANLIRLALSNLDVEFYFSQPPESKDQLKRDYQWILVDDSAVPTLNKLNQFFPNQLPKVPLIYLSQKNFSESEQKKISPWILLKKPFHPGEIKAVLFNQ